MKVKDYKSIDVLNGWGTRSSIWFAGCDHMCKGCFSQNTWKYETDFDDDIYKLVERDMTDTSVVRDGISLLGGDPLYTMNRGGLLRFLGWFNDKFPDKTVWLWTGYTKDQCVQDIVMCGILKYVDVLIDGKFDENKKDPSLIWRGSSNQIIHFLKEV